MLSKKKTWYALKVAPEGQVSEVEIFDEIGFWGITAEQFRKDFLSVIDANNNDVRLLINSPGGGVFDGMTIYNTIFEHKARVTVEVVGLAASMASIIALAGDRLVMNPGTFLMIHNPWSYAGGDAESLRKEAEVLDKIAESMASIYAGKSGLSIDEVKTLMDLETWLSGQEAHDKGFADEVRIEGKAAAMAFNLSKFQKVPKGLETAPNKSEEIPVGESENIQALLPEEKKGGSNMPPKEGTNTVETQPNAEPDINKLADMVSAKLAPILAGVNRQIAPEDTLAKEEKEHIAAFTAFLKRDPKGASLTTSDLSIPTSVANKIFERAAELSIPRRMGVVFENYAPNVKIPILPAAAAMAIVAEGGNFPDAQTTPTSLTLDPKRLLGKFSASDLAIQGGMDILGMFIKDAGRAIALAENNYFINGNHAATPAEPQGATVGGALGKTTAGASAIAVADIMDFFYSIDPAYRDSVFWILNPAVYKLITKLTDGVGNYLYMAGSMYAPAPNTIHGRPVLETSKMNGTVTTGLKTALLVDPNCFKAASFGGIQTRVQQNQSNGNIEYLVTHYYDHKVADTAGVKWLIQA